MWAYICRYFISTGEVNGGGGVQMPTLTEENSQFVRSWPQEDSPVMDILVLIVVCIC